MALNKVQRHLTGLRASLLKYVFPVPFMKESYHCRPCDKEFIEADLAAQHRQRTGHEVIQRRLEN